MRERVMELEEKREAESAFYRALSPSEVISVIWKEESANKHL
jgi:hypothetical protein